MAILVRPPKEGTSTTTYQGKVAQGYTTILAAEVDADFDAIYAAWNLGVDTVNIADNSITSAKLQANSVGTRELVDGGVMLVDLAPEVKAAGGDLSGLYPNPQVRGVSTGVLQWTPRGAISALATTLDISANNNNVNGYDSTKPGWLFRLNYGTDAVEFWHAAPGIPLTYAQVFAITNAGKITGGATVGARQHITPPGAFVTTTYNTPVLVCTLPAITTRGGAVLLVMNHALWYSSSAVSGNGPISVLIYRNGVSLPNAFDTHNYGSGGAQVVEPIPPLVFVDTPAAGTWTYDLRVSVSNVTSPTVSCAGFGDCSAQEIG